MTLPTLCSRAEVWRQFALSLADVLVAIQAHDGSFARQYIVPSSSSSSSSFPIPSDLSTTSTILPTKYLAAAYVATGNISYYTSALAAGEYAWTTYHQFDWYIGAAIDNPDVLDKESALFALDGYLALYMISNNRTWIDRASAASLIASTWMRITNLPNPVDNTNGMDWNSTDTSAGLGLIATGHSGSDTFDSMMILPRLQLCALTNDPAVHAVSARLALVNSKQPLDLDGFKKYFHRGVMSELFAFSVGWDIFSGHNDGRGVGDFHFVPWTSANGAYGIAQFCLSFLSHEHHQVEEEENNGIYSLPPECSVGVPTMPVC